MADVNTVLTYVAIVTSVGSAVLGVINHKQIRSRCCGRSASVSLDIDSTTPAANREPMLGSPPSDATAKGVVSKPTPTPTYSSESGF